MHMPLLRAGGRGHYLNGNQPMRIAPRPPSREGP